MKKYYDVIVIGAGIAGLFTALNIDKRLSVLIVSKGSIDSTNSTLAQGGIVSCISPDVHFGDTMRAGAFYNKEEAVKVVENDSKKNIEKLIEYGVEFDRDELGNLKFTKEGGHSENTILYSKDQTGKEIIRVLSSKINKSSNISVLENTSVIKLIKDKNSISGIVVLDRNEDIKIYGSKYIVLATGGLGQIYKNTTNREEITGDGISLGIDIGAKVRDMEFIQFHPTAMYSVDSSRRFLISEAVRGEGGVLRNINGQLFMHKYHKLKDLASRDIVSRSIFREMESTNSEFVYLDMTSIESEYIKNRFPNIYNNCLRKGIDITKDYIPVAPAEHYVMGGISTNLNGKTNIEGLFACGECACTGLHGANRLASNSLLEGIVFARRVAENINYKCLNKNYEKNEMIEIKKYENMYRSIKQKDKLKNDIFYEMENRLRQTMTDYVSIIRNKRNLLKSKYILDNLQEKLDKNKTINKKYFELKSMITVSNLVIEGALKREKSLGVHFITKDEGERVG